MSNWPPGTIAYSLNWSCFGTSQPLWYRSIRTKTRILNHKLWIPNLNHKTARVCYLWPMWSNSKPLNGLIDLWCPQMSLSFEKGGTLLHVWGPKSENTNDISSFQSMKNCDITSNHGTQPGADYIRRFLM